jgi:opacity protein-like surface antigen
VQGVGGLTFQAEVATVVGAEAGVAVGRGFVVYAQGGRLFDVLPQFVRDDLDEGARTLTELTGRRWQFDARIPATYVGGGVKYFFPLRMRLRPYALGGVGAVRYKGSLREVELGDVLDLAVSFGLVDDEDVEGTEGAYEIGGGVAIPVDRLQIDLAYRLMNVRGVNISRLAGGIGIRF